MAVPHDSVRRNRGGCQREGEGGGGGVRGEGGDDGQTAEGQSLVGSWWRGLDPVFA